jgi:hypothetical protein
VLKCRVFYNSPLHPSESIPTPSHRSSKKSGDPNYLKNEKADNSLRKHSNDNEDSKTKTKSSDSKHKSHHKKHKKEKSSKSTKTSTTQSHDIDLLEAEPGIEVFALNGKEEHTENVFVEDPVSEDMPKSVQSDFVDDFLEDLDPVKSGNNNNGDVSTKLEEVAEIASEPISAGDFVDLLAGGELKFKKRLEVPNENDMGLKKVNSY